MAMISLIEWREVCASDSIQSLGDLPTRGVRFHLCTLHDPGTSFNVQALGSRIQLPFGFNRPYRCIVKYVRHYTIEELGSFIWIGGLVSRYGPPGFRELWSLLQPALCHYMYGCDATEEDMRAASRSLWAFACCLENKVLQGVVRLRVGACSRRHACTTAYFS